ncbi:hypothetical protein EB796_015249 [Bugula neritina]|uniref:Uncharacterized protein n=1 Tax=Bugula neritina TaxID=10212 RepID=A0A7J7JKR9_BUGNE|nr:hypothetical protein EB796_015249 [Bugula neritina]
MITATHPSRTAKHLLFCVPSHKSKHLLHNNGYEFLEPRSEDCCAALWCFSSHLFPSLPPHISYLEPLLDPSLDPFLDPIKNSYHPPYQKTTLYYNCQHHFNNPDILLKPHGSVLEDLIALPF